MQLHKRHHRDHFLNISEAFLTPSTDHEHLISYKQIRPISKTPGDTRTEPTEIFIHNIGIINSMSIDGTNVPKFRIRNTELVLEDCSKPEILTLNGWNLLIVCIK